MATATDTTPAAETAATPARMPAITQHRYGGADELRPAEIDVPAIAADEVLVRVAAAGLDRGTWHLMTGRPYLLRLLGFGLRAPRVPVPGLDLAGTVVAVGAAVRRLAVGDEVFGIGRGTFAGYAAARADRLAHRPAGVSVSQAAVLGVSGLTALQAVRDAGRVRSGQRVLVTGASGGVGTYAVQVAHALGAEVTGVCSAAKADLVRSLGATRVVDYALQDFAEERGRYDVIVDIAGNATLSRLRRALAPRGTLVIAGGEGGGSVLGGFDRQLRAVALSPFVRQRLTMVAAKQRHADLERLAELVEAGDVTPAVDAVYPLERAAEAMRHLVSGRVRGKVVIQVAEATSRR